MSTLNHVFEELDIVVAPIDFAPVRMLASVGVNRVRIGDEEKCGRETITVKKRNGPLELATQSIIKGERDQCRTIHISWPCESSRRLCARLRLIRLNQIPNSLRIRLPMPVAGDRIGAAR